jgi:hypothetical protein
MRAIVRSTGVLTCLVISSLIADTHDEIVDVIGNMANALSTVNAPKFMDAFDKSMPGYETLKSNVTALANQSEITSSIEIVKEDGDDNKRVLDLDWYLEIRSLLPDGPIERRREVVHCELVRKDKKHWKIVSMQPMNFFAPAKLDK